MAGVAENKTSEGFMTGQSEVTYVVPTGESAIIFERYNVSNSTTNFTGSANMRDEDLAKIEIGVQGFIFMLALLGNTIVLLALRYRKKKTSRMHLFIMHLSIADLLVAFCNVLPQMAWDITYQFQGPDALCRIVKYLQVMVIYLSTYVLVMTAIDRYRAICHPLSNYSWSTKRVNLMIGVAWALSMFLSLPQLVIFRLKSTPSGALDCWAEFGAEWIMKAYVTCFMLSVYILPFLILTALYGRICYELWKNLQCRKQGLVDGMGNGKIVYKFNGTGTISITSPNETDTHEQNWSAMSGRTGQTEPKEDRGGQGLKRLSDSSYSCECHRNLSKSSQRGSLRGCHFRGMSRSKLMTIKLTFVVILAYMLCWSPFFITQMWWAFDASAPADNATFVICLLLASLNSCCNPWIYMAFSASFIQTALPCCRPRPRKPQYFYQQRVCSLKKGLNSPVEKVLSEDHMLNKGLIDRHKKHVPSCKLQDPRMGEHTGNTCAKCATRNAELWKWKCNLFPSTYKGRASGYLYRSQPVATCPHRLQPRAACDHIQCEPLHDIQEEHYSNNQEEKGWSFFKQKTPGERYKKSRKCVSQPSLMNSRQSSDIKLEARCTSV